MLIYAMLDAHPRMNQRFTLSEAEDIAARSVALPRTLGRRAPVRGEAMHSHRTFNLVGVVSVMTRPLSVRRGKSRPVVRAAGRGAHCLARRLPVASI
jgi:hypothetical protein